MQAPGQGQNGHNRRQMGARRRRGHPQAPCPDQQRRPRRVLALPSTARTPACPPGPLPRRRHARSMIKLTPGEPHPFEFALWTREMVREVIRREFAVRLSVVSVGRLLRKLGLSPQRPLHRAYQPNPEAVDRWKRQEYPAIRAQAEAEGATIYFADEA